MYDRDGGVNLGEIERGQIRKLRHLGFIAWSFLMIIVGALLAKC